MKEERVEQLAEKFGVAPGVVSSLYGEARQDLEAESAQAAGHAAQQKADMLKAADEAMRAGDVQKSIALKRKAHGVQIGK